MERGSDTALLWSEEEIQRCCGAKGMKNYIDTHAPSSVDRRDTASHSVDWIMPRFAHHCKKAGCVLSSFSGVSAAMANISIAYT